MILIDAIKKKLHRDIVADPVLHARVLNLYLCGEAYPHTVDDYFPVAYAPNPELAASMTAHQADEDKHIALYRKAIRMLDQEVQDLAPEHIFNHVIRSHGTEPWNLDAGMAPSTRIDRVASFLAHAHFLEKRVARSLEFHHDACAQANSDYPGKAVAAVLSDEQRHVRYTVEAVHDLLPRARATALIRAHARAEQRANLDFSARQLKRLLIEEHPHWPRGSRLFHRACAAVMQGALACA